MSPELFDYIADMKPKYRAEYLRHLTMMAWQFRNGILTTFDNQAAIPIKGLPDSGNADQSMSDDLKVALNI